MQILKKLLFIICIYTHIFAAATPAQPVDEITALMQSLSIEKNQEPGKTALSAVSTDKTSAVLNIIADLIANRRTVEAVAQIEELSAQGIAIDTAINDPLDEQLHGMTLLHVATNYENISVIDAIFAAGGNPNVRINS